MFIYPYPTRTSVRGIFGFGRFLGHIHEVLEGHLQNSQHGSGLHEVMEALDQFGRIY